MNETGVQVRCKFGTTGQHPHSCAADSCHDAEALDDCALGRTYGGRTSYARGLKSKPGSHVDCGNGGAPRGAWRCPARVWRNRHQRCGTRVDLETAGDFAPQGAESSLDLSWGISAPVLAFAPPARFHWSSCSLPMRRFAEPSGRIRSES